MMKSRLLNNFCILLIAICAIIHIIIVTSIIIQPLDVNSTSGENQSLVWGLYNDSVHRKGPGADFFAIYHAGVMMKNGYTPYERIEEPQVTPYYFDYRYLPIVATALGQLLIKFQPLIAYRIWVVLIESILLMLIFQIFLIVKEQRWRCLIGCTLLLSTPYFLELHMGQFTFITLALFAIGILIKEIKNNSIYNLGNEVIFTLTFLISVILKMITFITCIVLFRFKRYWLNIAVVFIILIITAMPYYPDDIKIFYQLNFSHPVGGLDAGNFSLLYLIYLLAKDRNIHWLIENWKQILFIWRIGIIGATAILALISNNRKPIVLCSSLLLAHFISYIHVWEHHMSGVIVIGILLLITFFNEKLSFWRNISMILVIVSLLFLALPSPFYWLDTIKNPAVWDPSTNWTPYARYFLVISKVGPVIVLYAVSISAMVKSGLKVRKNIFLE